MPTHVFGDFELDTSLYQLRRNGEIIDIGPRVFDVLSYLIQHRDRLVSKDELIREVWGATAMSGSSVPTCIAAVRKALGDDPAKPVFVETHRGRGYRFISEVTEISAAARTETPSIRGSGASARGISGPIFVGRDSELAALYSAFERALSGTPQLVLVIGEAGIGKTRTIEEFAPSVRDDGAVVLLGRCAEGEGAPAFWPWVQIVRTYVESSDVSTLPAALGPVASSLLQMIPELRDRFPDLPPPPTLDAEQARFRLFDAVTALLTKAAAERPLVVLLDDLHRADAASLLLLQFAIREIRETQVVFVGTYRGAELQADIQRSQLLSDLAREEPARCIELHGLTRENVEHFIAQSSPSGIATESLVAALYDQTGGNPFFLTQIVHLLTAEGRLDQTEADPSWKIDLPGGVREAVSRQLDGLPSNTRRTLAIAAVAGREFATTVIAAASESDAHETLANLEPAIDARLISPVPGQIERFRFTHMLLRDAIYDELPTLGRVQLHHRIGEALEALHFANLGPYTSELAYHFYEAIPTAGTKPAITYSIQAGEWATSRLAYEDVPDHYKRALSLLDREPSCAPLQRGNLRLELGESELRAGQREQAQKTLKDVAFLARNLAAPELLARAALSLAPGFFAIEVGVFDTVQVSLLEEALSALPETDSPLRAQVLARLSTALVWSNAEHRRTALSLEAFQMAQRLADTQTLARTLSARHEALWGPGDFKAREHVIATIGALASQVTDPEIRLNYHLLQTTAFLESGNVTAADQEILKYTDIAYQTRQPQYLWYIDLFSAMRALMKGDFQTAQSFAYRFLSIGVKAKDSNAYQSFGTHLAILRWEEDRSAEILPAVERFIELYPSVTAWKCVKLFLHQDLNQIDDSRAQFEHFARSNFSSIACNTNRIVSLCLLAEVCSSLEDTERARILYEILLPEQAHYAIIGFSTGFFGSVEERLGLLAFTLGRFDQAATHFERAISAHKQLGTKPWIARTQYHYTRLLLHRRSPNDVATAAALARSSAHTAKRLSMENLSRRLTDLRTSFRLTD